MVIRHVCIRCAQVQQLEEQEQERTTRFWAMYETVRLCHQQPKDMNIIQPHFSEKSFGAVSGRLVAIIATIMVGPWSIIAYDKGLKSFRIFFVLGGVDCTSNLLIC